MGAASRRAAATAPFGSRPTRSSAARCARPSAASRARSRGTRDALAPTCSASSGSQRCQKKRRWRRWRARMGSSAVRAAARGSRASPAATRWNAAAASCACAGRERGSPRARRRAKSTSQHPLANPQRRHAEGWGQDQPAGVDSLTAHGAPYPAGVRPACVCPPTSHQVLLQLRLRVQRHRGAARARGPLRVPREQGVARHARALASRPQRPAAGRRAARVRGPPPRLRE